jgi:hypothetical protein
MTEMTETYQIPKIPHSKNNGQKYTGGIFLYVEEANSSY